jgi:hypothetical protein
MKNINNIRALGNVYRLILKDMKVDNEDLMFLQNNVKNLEVYIKNKIR